MCGIAGILKKENNVDNTEISDMLNTMVHRGPDQFGVYTEENYGIGHRRLSIIDLEDGKQPMSNSSKMVLITFNGEIYNYKELRSDLERQGYKFRTKSDTEVILHLYEEFGFDCLNKLRGMFAFCIVDVKKRLFFCARDNLGIKPLVYYFDGDVFAFASEIQALKTVKGFDKSINFSAIDQFLWLQYIPAPDSIFQKVKKLKPGHYITVDFDLNISGQNQWFDFGFDIKNSNQSHDAWLNEFDNVFSDSIQKHLISDVSYGAFLSGGIDSTLVVDYMSRILDVPVETFSIGFENDDNSEVEYAEYAAKKIGSNHHCQIIKGDAFKILPELVSHYGEPFGDSSAIPTYYVSKMASNYVKMVLSGDGGDELFCGYRRYDYWKNFCEKSIKLNFYEIKKLCSQILHDGKIEKRDSLESYLKMVQYLGHDLRSKLWKAEYKNCVCKSIPDFETEYSKTKRLSCLHKAQYFDMKTYMPYDCLTKVDIASMCHSIEVRTPFVDKEVLNFALRLPIGETYYKTSEYGFQGKFLLKEMLAKDLGNDFVYRTKRGFSIPLQNWLRDENNFACKMKNALLSDSTNISSFFDKNIIKQIVESNNPYHIYVLIFLEEWLSQNI